MSDLDGKVAHATAVEISVAGGRAVGIAANVTEEKGLSALAKKAIAGFGKLTILLNNAGGGGPRPFDMPMEDFRRAFDLNVFSVFRLSQLAVPHMEKAGRGAILNVSSMAAENRNVRMTSYGASKAAESHLTRNMAFDLGPKGIR